jgi:hypothetical protein
MPLLEDPLIPSLLLPRNAFTALLRRPAEAIFLRLVGLQAHLPLLVALALLARLTSVTLVRVRIAGGEGGVLSVAAELRDLKVLDIVFFDGADLRGTQPRGLGNLGNLAELQITTRTSRELLRSHDFHAADVISLARCLPNLVRLVMNVVCDSLDVKVTDFVLKVHKLAELRLRIDVDLLVALEALPLWMPCLK